MGHLLKHLKPYTKECIIAPLFKMIEATFELLVPLVIAYIINIGIDNKDTKTSSNSHHFLLHLSYKTNH